jgi:hypothetical protein
MGRKLQETRPAACNSIHALRFGRERAAFFILLSQAARELFSATHPHNARAFLLTAPAAARCSE